MPCLRGRSLLTVLLTIGSVTYYLLLRLSAERTNQRFEAQTADSFSWSKLEPSDKLVWRKCFSTYECARLMVPLNYSEPDGNSAIIALTRVPSPLPADSPWYRGPILINPGGPGGSGVGAVVAYGGLLSAIVGPQFDVVGFDPRGVGRSIPRMSFFDTDVERELWGNGGLAVLNATTDGIARAYARAKILGQLATERQLDELRHINTDQTARDMLRITEAHGREKIQYWGFSYGSILGATFAAMFPNRVERLVIDGVCDAENYYAALWSNNLMDTDKTMQAFFDQCAAAGPNRCPFYAPSAEDIARNLTALYDAKPFATFLPLASGLADLAAGDGTRLFQLLETPPFQCSCDTSTSPKAIKDAQMAIACNDGDVVPPSLEELQKYFDETIRASGWSEIWASIRTECVGWPQLPKIHFRGSFVIVNLIFQRGPFVGNTSFPLLLVGNTADPVTPLWAAKKMSKGFVNSVVLTQDSPGHCSMAAPSLCTQKYIRNYFVEGTLPPPNTICPVIGSPFPKLFPADQVDSQGRLTSSDQNLLDVVQKLSNSFEVPFPL